MGSGGLISYSDAIVSLVPDAQFSISEDKYETLQWFSDADVPSEQRIIEEVDRLNAESEMIEYRTKRAIAYPPVEDQLDMMYWDAVNGTNLWIDTISQVKEAYPKP